MAITSLAKRNAALLDQPVVWPDGMFDGTDRANMVGQYQRLTVQMFFGPTRPGVAWAPTSPPPGVHPAAMRLMRHYGTVTEGVNVYILTDGTVTQTEPTDWSTVQSVLWGAHEEPVTGEEAAVLVGAGYGGYLS